MIADLLGNIGRYFRNEASGAIRGFIAGLGETTPVGEYEILGRELYASVATYETRKAESALFETHRRYIDLQVVVAGREYIEWTPSAGLEIETPYQPDRDVEFYKRPSSVAGRLLLTPGSFVLLFPWDAHAPQIQVEAPSQVRKVVVKIHKDLLPSA